MANMKKKIISMFIMSCVLLITVSISLVYGWIVYEKDTEYIDGNTSGIKFVYEINDELKVQSCKYSISDVAFFDIDNLGEINHFLEMACEIKLEVRNTGDLDLNYTISQTAGMVSAESTAGIICLFSQSQLTASSISSYETINAMITSSSSPVSESVSGNLVKYNEASSTSDSDTYYVYIIGVQTNDQANNDFLSLTYDFTITINTQS